MYGIYTNLGGILMVNVTIYIYHTWIYIAYMDLVLILVIILL